MENPRESLTVTGRCLQEGTLPLILLLGICLGSEFAVLPWAYVNSKGELGILKKDKILMGGVWAGMSQNSTWDLGAKKICEV